MCSPRTPKKFAKSVREKCGVASSGCLDAWLSLCYRHVSIIVVWFIESVGSFLRAISTVAGRLELRLDCRQTRVSECVCVYIYRER